MCVLLTCRTGMCSCSATHVGRVESDLFVSPQTVRPSSPRAWGMAHLSAAVSGELRALKNIKQTNITIKLWSIAKFSLSGSFKIPLKLDLKHFCFYNAFKFNRLKLSGAGKANAATQYAQSVADSFESVVSSENTILSKMTDWDPQTQSMTSCSSFLTGEVQKQCFLMFMHNIVPG